jgi:hypothetical protein
MSNDDIQYVDVFIENAYSDGHQSVCEEPVPAPDEDDNLDDWWQEQVFPLTGDGHGDGADLGSVHVATITAGPAWLVGKQHEWGD